MQVNAINSSTNNRTVFRKLIIDKSVAEHIHTMPERDQAELSEITKRLSKTKFWDLKVYSVYNNLKNLSFNFIAKSHNNRIISDSIFPYDKSNKNIQIYSIVYGDENSSKNVIETLKFKTKKRADELYKQYTDSIQYLQSRNFNVSPIELIKNKEIQINMLEEAYKNRKYSTNKKIIDTHITTKTQVGTSLRKDK